MEKEDIEISKGEKNNKVSKKNKRTKILIISLISVLVLALAITLMVVLLTPKNYYTINTNSTDYVDIIVNKSEATAGEEVEVKTIIKEGYEVLSVYYMENNSTTKIEIYNKFKMPSKDINIYAKIQPISYTITYNLNDGQISGQKESYTVEDETFTLPTPEKSNCEFLGWTWDGQETPQKQVIIEKGSIGNKVYTANWQQTNISISINEDILNHLNIEKQQVEENGKVVAVKVSIKNLSNERYIITDDNIYDVNNIFYTVWNGEKTKIINNTFTINLPSNNITIEVEGYRRLDNFQFNENSVLGYNGTESNLIIPSYYSTLNIGGKNYNIEKEDITITSIGSSFSSEIIQSVTIPSSVESVEISAFISCSAIKNVYYTGSIDNWVSIKFKSEGANPLYHGAKLYTKENGNYELVEEIKITKNIGQYSFYGCKSLTNVELLEGAEIIGFGAFYGCSSLTSVTIGNQATDIESDAFFKCSNLTKIVLSSSLKNIGSRAFAECTSLKYIEIPEKVETLGSHAFWSCSGLTDITLPSSLKILYNYTFANCSNLKSITMLGVTSIGEYVFSKCNKLTNISLPATLTTIGSYAFSECTSLTNISLPSSLTNIGSYVFSNSGLTSVKIPDSIEILGTGSFSGCSNLKSVELGTGVKSIFAYAFDGCGQLTSIKIPNNITNIVRNAFSNCDSLRSVIIDSEEIYKKLTSNTACGSLIENATRIEILTTIVDKEGNTNSYLNDINNYTKVISNDRQYYIYQK